VVLADLQGEGFARKEAFLLKAFLVTLVATKVTATAAIERSAKCNSNYPYFDTQSIPHPCKIPIFAAT
jgi:hypothetical protein